MNIQKLSTLLFCSALILGCAKPEAEVKTYTTTADKTLTMDYKAVALTSNSSHASTHLIEINPEVKFQEMEGFGAAITGSTCYNLLKMTKEDRQALLEKTFNPTTGYGYSYIRISIGCSDFSLDEYTYCDTPGIENFKIHPYDERDLFPILKEIQAINPDIKIMASPWTPPKWMKVNNLTDLEPFDSWTSGQLNPTFYADYATYFVKYIQAMEKEGFTINTVTIQNEPLNRGNSASLFMTWQEQKEFIKTALGPAFEANNIKTKIIAYDHNYNYDDEKEETFDQQQYPLHIYADSEASKYVDGAAYHAYGGEVTELDRIHQEAPDKSIYFTEMSIGLWGSGYDFGGDLMWNMKEVCLGTINRWNKAVIMWNFMLDDKHGPYRKYGCNICLGAIDISSEDYKTMTFNSHYYTMAHLSQVIKPGAFRIESKGNTDSNIHYSAFINPDQSMSMVLLNEGSEEQLITIQAKGKSFSLNVAPQSVVSCIW